MKSKNIQFLILLGFLLLSSTAHSQQYIIGYSNVFTIGEKSYEPSTIILCSNVFEMNTMGTYFYGYSNLFALNTIGTIISGTVSDEETGETLPDANVYLEGTSYFTTSNEFGEYTITNVEPGNYSLTAEAEGYEPFTISDLSIDYWDYIILNFELQSIAPTLTGIEAGVEALTLTWEPHEGASRIDHFDFIGGNPADPVWTIYIAHSGIDGENMVAGDKLAVFDGDLLVGVFTLEQVCDSANTFENDLVAWSTLVGGDGYTPGNPVTYKAWDESNQIEIAGFEATYLDWYGDAWTEPVYPEGDGEYSIVQLQFSTNQYEPLFNIYYSDGTLVADSVEGTSYTDSGLQGGNEYCYYITKLLENGMESDTSNTLCGIPFGSQEIELEQGYNFVSSYLIPFEADLLDVLPGILGNLDIVRNQNGNVLRKIGPNWINGISDWVTTEGYLFRMNAPDTLTIEGDVIDPTTPVPMSFGYQFVSYLPVEALNAMDAFETIIGDSLNFIRDENGNVLRKIGPAWVNGIGNAVPDEFYLVKMNGSDELIYPGDSKGFRPEKSTSGKHILGNAADPVYTIYLMSGEGIETGDRIMAYDGSKLVGTTTINSDNWQDNELAAFSTLNNSDGYQPDNLIKLVLERNGEQLALSLEMKPIHKAYAGDIYPQGDGIYSIARISATTTGIGDLARTTRIYPNPATGQVVVSSSNNIQWIRMHDMQSQLILERNINDSNIELDVSAFNPGVYLVEIKVAGEIVRKKLVLK